MVAVQKKRRNVLVRKCENDKNRVLKREEDLSFPSGNYILGWRNLTLTLITSLYFIFPQLRNDCLLLHHDILHLQTLPHCLNKVILGSTSTAGEANQDPKIGGTALKSHITSHMCTCNYFNDTDIKITCRLDRGNMRIEEVKLWFQGCHGVRVCVCAYTTKSD